MTVYDQLVAALRGREGQILSTAEIKKLISDKFGRNPGSVIPSDYCYNRRNDGIPHTRHLFEYLGRSQYKVLGPGKSYSGQVFERRRGTKGDQLVGGWKSGRPPR